MPESRAPSRSSRPMLGVVYMCTACALFPIMNGLVKLLAASYDAQQIVWFRIFSHLVLVAAVFMPRMGLGLLRTRRVGTQIISSLMMLLSTLFFFSAVKYVPVAEAISVTFVAPLAVVLLAWPLLGERITRFRLFAVIVGFSGVLIVIRPGSAVFQWASVLLLGSAICYSIYQILIRRLAATDAPATSIFYSVLLGAALMTVWLPFVWKTPGNLLDWGLLCSLGMFGALGHYCVAKAMTHASANFIAPFNYTQMIGSVIVGYLMFAEVPDFYTWLGTAVIVAAGLLVGLHGGARNRVS